MRSTLLLITGLILCASSNAQVPSYVPTDGLIGWWPFNGNANDESGNGNDGVVSGAVLTTDRNGMIEAAYSFNGVSDFIETTAQGPLGTTARTFSFWVRSGNTAHQTPIDYYGVEGGAFQPILNNPCPGLGVDAGSGVVTRGDETLLDASWHHCTLVFDPTVGNTISSVMMYIDGVEQVSIACNALDANAEVNTTSTGPILFGKTTSNIRYVNGDLDDIGIWNRALNASEIQILFTADITAHSCGATNVHNAIVEYGSMTDQDGNFYTTVEIGDRTWMAENLKAGHYRNGDPIPVIISGAQWGAASAGASCWHNNDSATYDCPYGRLYNWYTVSDARNVCPSGWHIPSAAEWIDLINLLGSNAGGQMKSQGIQYWTGGNLGGSNQSGFSGLPGGSRGPLGQTTNELGILAHFWSSTTDTEGLVNSVLCRLHFGQTNAETFTWDNRYGFSVRCIQDLETGTGLASEHSSITSAALYPNPSHGTLVLEFELAGQISLAVFDALGRTVHEEVFLAKGNKSIRNLDLSKLVPGTYLLRVSNSGNTATKRFVLD